MDTLFLGQAASNAGGAVAVTNQAIATIVSCNFWQNSVVSSSGSGGAVFVDSGATLFMSTTSFDNNTAAYGGAISLNAATATLDTLKFTANAAALSGGAVSAVSSNVTSTSNTFIFNFAASSASTGAGAMYAKNSIVNMQWGYLANNTAPSVSVESGSSVVLNTTEVLSSVAYSDSQAGASVKCSSSALELVDNDISGARSAASGNLVQNILCDSCSGSCVSCKLEFLDPIPFFPGRFKMMKVSLLFCSLILF